MNSYTGKNMYKNNKGYLFSFALVPALLLLLAGMGVSPAGVVQHVNSAGSVGSSTQLNSVQPTVSTGTSLILGTMPAGTTPSLATAITAINITNIANITNATNESNTSSTMDFTPQAPPGDRFIRIRALEPGWAMSGHNAEDAIAMISQLKPDALERYTNGPLDPDQMVPTAPGDKKMNVAQFLNASMEACSCYIIPRVDSYSAEQILSDARKLRSLPISPKMEYLSIDNWKSFYDSVHGNKVVIANLFKSLYAQGWKGVGVNECEGYETTYGYASFADPCINVNSWTPNYGQIEKIEQEPNIKKLIFYIDFPGQVRNFENLSNDKEAQILTSLAYNQSKYSYALDYNIYQVGPENINWDAQTRFTSKNGLFDGASIYEVMNQLMDKYNSKTFFLTTSPSGCALPDSDKYIQGSKVVITARIKCDGALFAYWKGSGTGSYTGSDRIDSIVMKGDISETAIYLQPNRKDIQNQEGLVLNTGNTTGLSISTIPFANATNSTYNSSAVGK